MTENELDDWLHAWGRAYGERLSDVAELSEDARAPDVHPLARGLRMAPGSRQAVIRRVVTMDRGGVSRRRLMARELASCGLTIVPAAFVDPVPGTRSSNASGGMPEFAALQSIAERVQSAWLVLHRVDELQAGVVRLEYQVRAKTQKEKAADQGVALGTYRYELARGRSFLLGKLAA